MKPLSVEQKRSLENATATYESQLQTAGVEALFYLNGRGLGTVEIERYRLGFVDEPEPEHEPYRGMICIPYIKITGVVGLKFRRLDDGKPKYLNPPGAGTHLYNTGALTRPGRVVGVCEGEFDAMTLDALCGIPAVGVPGVTHWKAHPEWGRLLDGRQVLVFPDNDIENPKNPGEELASTIVNDLPSARIVRLPAPEPGESKMDVNLCYMRYGADEIRKRAGL